MHWIQLHRLGIGIGADSLTFLGALILARDAFLRLRELKKARIDKRFGAEFPRLNLTDDELDGARVAVRWALTGFVLLMVGFLGGLLVRIAEAQACG
jgi:hypothetical protein